jgi:hypothetical protein
VDTPGGQDWFLHFQDRGAFGRVVHLQPMRWGADGWPRIGRDAGDRPGEPVSEHAAPAVTTNGHRARPAPNDGLPGPQWSWAANPDPSWWSPRPPYGVRLVCARSPRLADLRRLPNVLGHRLPLGPADAVVTLTLASDVPGARAGLTVLGRSYAWIGLEHTATGDRLVCRASATSTEPETDLSPPVPLPAGPATARLRVRVGSDATCRFDAGAGDAVGGEFRATAGHWVGATIGLFAAAPPGAGPAGHADVDHVEVTGA